MTRTGRIVGAGLCLLSTLCISGVGAEEEPLRLIALGSCAHQDSAQRIWDGILDLKPQLFVFLGDNVYADATEVGELSAAYAKLNKVAGFRRLRSSVPILATWDDHDYGTNDFGGGYPLKLVSEEVFLDFFEEPESSERRSRPGVYDARIYGPSDRRLQIILLDARYFRSALKKNPRGRNPLYVPNPSPDVTMLGDAQWDWLEALLRVPASVRILVSGIQLVNDDHGFETWGNFPQERRRLIEAIQSTNGVIMVSGDRHFSELSKLKAEDGYPIYDLTSSGLTQTITRGLSIPNTRRVGEPYIEKSFGSVTIDWDAENPIVRLGIHDVGGDVVFEHTVRLSELQPKR